MKPQITQINADEYKKLCVQPNAFSRNELEITEKILREKNLSVALHLSDTLQTSPIKKPEKHKGDKFTDYFLITLLESEAEMIVDIFTDLEAQNIENDGMTTPMASSYAEVADKWITYLSFIGMKE